MAVTRNHLQQVLGDNEKGVGPERLAMSLVKNTYLLDTFMTPPIPFQQGSPTDLPAGTSLDVDILRSERYIYEYYPLGTNTDKFFPSFGSEGGWDFGASSDVVGTGFELNFGSVLSGHPRNFFPKDTVNLKGRNWFARVLIITDDASGLDLFFGFRKVAAPLATLTELSDVVGWRALGASGSTDATFTLITNLNNAGATDYTSTTPLPAPTGLEDATAIELEMRAVAGVAEWRLNNQGTLYGGVTYPFDDGDEFSPCLRMVQATDIAAQIKLLCAEAGPLEDRQAGTLLSLAGATT